MSTSRFSRRRFLFAAGAAVLAAPLVQACGGQAPSPTTAPATKASDSAKTEPTKGAAAQPTTAAAKPASQGSKTALSIAVWTFADRPWQEEQANKYGKEHSDVALEVIQVPYADMEKKQLTMIATNTMPDVVFSGVKWFAYSAFKGAFYALDDLVKTNDPGMDDFFKDTITNSTLDGKLYALPFEFNPGNTNVVMYNKDMLAAKGVTEPTDEWTYEQFLETSKKLVDTDKKIWGTTLLPTNYYDLATWIRSYKGDILSDDGKQFTLTTDEKAVEIARWVTELRTVHKVAPSRAEAEGLAFAAEQVALNNTGVQSVLGTSKTIADKFKWDVVLAPVGPNGLRGYEAFTTMYSMSAKTKAADKAYELLTYMTSKETATNAFLEQGQPPARASIWESPEAQKLNTIYGRVAKWVSTTQAKGPFPMPYNLRFSELQDKFGNLIQPVYYGEVGFEEGIKKVQDECQQIVALPRG